MPKALYLSLDYDKCCSILFKEQLNYIIKRLAKKTRAPVADLKNFCAYYRRQRKKAEYRKMGTAGRIQKIIDGCSGFTKDVPIFLGAMNYLARYIEIKSFLWKTLRGLSKQYGRTVLITGSRRQSKEQDKKIAVKNKNGQCTLNFPKLAKALGCEFDATLFPDTYTDPTKLNLHLNWFDHISKQLLPGEEADFCTLDDLPLVEVVQYFKENEQSAPENSHFFMGHFQWDELIKGDDCIYTLPVLSICNRRQQRPVLPLQTKAPAEEKTRPPVTAPRPSPLPVAPPPIKLFDKKTQVPVAKNEALNKKFLASYSKF